MVVLKRWSQDFQENIFLGTVVLECSGIDALKTKGSVVKYVMKTLCSETFLRKFDSQSPLAHWKAPEKLLNLKTRFRLYFILKLNFKGIFFLINLVTFSQKSFAITLVWNRLGQILFWVKFYSVMFWYK